MTDTNNTDGFYSVFPERRINPFRPELRAATEDGKPTHIRGYASVYNKLSRKLGGFVERVNPSAFQESRAMGWPDVVCRFNHNDDFLLGTIRGGTLTLDTDDTGLIYTVRPPSFRSDIMELMTRGDVGSSSFAFRTPEGGDEWGLSDFNYPLRTLHQVDLVDVAPVTTPAYPDATAAARSMEGAISSLALKFDADPTEIRSLLDNNQGVKLFKRSDRPSIPPASQQAPTNQEPVMNQEDTDMDERAKLTYKQRKDLPKSAFAYVDPEGVGHFPIHDAAHVRNALARIAQGAKYGKEALPKVKAAAKKFGIDTNEQNSLGQLGVELASEDRELAAWFITTEMDEEAYERMMEEDGEERAAKKPADGSSANVETAPGSSQDDDADQEEDEDDEDESGKGVEGEERKSQFTNDVSDKVSTGLTNKRRLAELLEKRFDPFYFGDEGGTSAE